MDDFSRLEGAVAQLVERFQAVARDNAELRKRISHLASELRDREAAIRDQNQRQQDVAKRLDEMIAQLDQLDAELGRRAADAE